MVYSRSNSSHSKLAGISEGDSFDFVDSMSLDAYNDTSPTYLPR